MAKKILYNPDHMTAISTGYGDCATSVGNIISLAATVQSTFDSNYEGQGKPIAAEAFMKITEHLNLLQSSLDVAGKYVSTALADMQWLDAELIPNP